jgi:phospholipid/cholesterol/gamma-HCH transport system permease protein
VATTLPRPIRSATKIVTVPVNGVLNGLEAGGEQLSFYLRSLGWVWRTLISYKKEVFRLLAEVSLGSGGLALIGGSVGVVAFLTFFTGTEVGLEGYQGLQQIGISAFAGFVSAYFNTREISPIVAGLALTATVGAGFTASIRS